MVLVVSDPERRPRTTRVCRWEATACAFASHLCILTTFNIPHHIFVFYAVALPVPDATFAVTNTLRRTLYVGTFAACFNLKTSSVITATFTVARLSLAQEAASVSGTSQAHTIH